MEDCPWDPEGVEVCLDPEGQLVDRRAAQGVDLRALYKRLVAARCLDLRVERLGLPMWVSCAGEEAVAVLTAMLAGQEDWIYPGVRDFALAPIRGLDLDDFARQILGVAADGERPYNGRPGAVAAADLGIAYAPEPLGLHLPLAAGQAHAQKLAGNGRATIAIFGEGLTTTAFFHETVALASACDLPLVLVCKSQLWPEGAPAEAGLLGDSVAERVKACGMWSRRVDGADVVAVHAALDQALRRARDARGPGLVEVVVTQLHAGTTDADIPAHRDPIERLRRHLDREGQWTPTFQDVIEAEVRGQLERAFTHAQAKEMGR
ncbi:thiamine pyrophosphate-dependent enzyme [Nannocystis punicea]|uniref:2-oxoisovalerate dehydrogenase subunit alpha n=1 Tax=Nannocystis punicea TaxID=2995304 RepID=A0ABY7H4C2_9BACT|nr:thiamine pyrophosphate-dependent enzyme [Nannocystis poenicansa]WAS94042.1 thiamine pyrophosphate-dependent enzyme [Nannocystis poenicansa]